MHKVILLCLLIGTNPTQQTQNSIAEGSRVYVMPSSWFEIEMVSALHTKNVPVVVVEARNAADFEIDAESESDGGQWVRQTATVSIKNLHTGEIIYAQKITKWASLRGTRSVAEACAKHINKNIVRLSAEELRAFQASPRFSDKSPAPNSPVRDTSDRLVPQSAGRSGSTVIHGSQGPSLGEIARQARAGRNQKIQTEEVERTQSDLPPVIGTSQNMTEPSKIASFIAACSGHPWFTALGIFAILWLWKAPNISVRVPLDRLFRKNNSERSTVTTDPTEHGWSRTKQFYTSTQSSNTDPELFAILGVQPGCTAEQLRAAYLKLVKQWHTDRLEGMAPELREFANREVSKINDAYAKLSQH